MPVIPLADLQPDFGVVNRLAAMRPGVVLGTGQAASGKVTTLLGLVHHFAKNGQAVTLLSDRRDHFAPFHPLPPNWVEVLVQPTATAWQQALEARRSSDDLLVVAPLNRENALQTFQAGASRWIFAALETVMVGVDVSYALREMAVGYDCFADNARCVWSQFLVGALCASCATEATLDVTEAEATGLEVHARVKREVGCGVCRYGGTAGLIALSDVTLIGDEQREIVRTALIRGIAISLGDDQKVPALMQARALLGRGAIGINTFMDVVRRNPILRAHGESERAAVQLDVLTALANRTLAGVVVSGPDRRVRFANARARKALNGGADLRIEGEHLTMASEIERTFAVGLAAAVSDEPRASRLSLRVDSCDARNVFIAPLPSAWKVANEDHRLALIVLGGAPSAEQLPSARDLRQYFDLTPAESNVALLLCVGLVPKAIARKLDVSLPTVRSHLRALLEKTGTARQSELLGLLSSLPSTSTLFSR